MRDLSVEESVDREIEARLALLTDELIADGWTPEAARAEAEQRLGDAAAIRRAIRIQPVDALPCEQEWALTARYRVPGRTGSSGEAL